MGMSALVACLGFTARQLNAGGLICGFIGAFILTFWGSLGWRINQNGSPVVPLGKVAINDPRRGTYARWMRIRYTFLPRLALGLISITFVAQFLALWAP
jgi:hypothetical protein